MKKMKLLSILFIIVYFFLTGCANSEYNNNYNQFNESYVVATEFVDKDKDVLKILDKIDINNLTIEMNKMKKAMDQMNTSANSDREKGLYGNVRTYYQGLEFLLYAAQNKNNLTLDEKMKVGLEIDLASMNRKEFKEGKK